MRQTWNVLTLISAIARAAAVVACFAGVLLFVSCGRTHSGATGASSAVGATHASPVGEACLAPTIPLANALAEIDAYPVPKGVSADTWTMLTTELKRLLIARSKDGKTVSIAASGALNAVTDLSATFDATGTKTTTTWTEALPGDYNNDGSVDIGDLGPVALYYGQFTNAGSNDGHKLVVGDGDPEINIADLQMIAENYSAHVQGYQVLRGLFNGTSTDWETTFRPNTNPANTSWSADRPSPPPVSARPTYTYVDDLTGIADTATVRYKVVPCGDGGAGWASNVATMPPPPTFSISGTVTTTGGAGLSYVKASVAPGGQSVASQADGTYAIANLPNGVYTLTAGHAGYSITPATEEVHVWGANVTGVDFTATALPPAWPTANHDRLNTHHSEYVGAQTNALQWTLTGYDSTPAIGARGILYVTGGGYLYALNSFDGSVLWSYNLAASWYSTPAVFEQRPDIPTVGDAVYVGCNDYHFYSINPWTGILNWKFTDGLNSEFGSPAIGADGTIYVGAAHYFYALNPSDGSVRWSYHPTTSYLYGWPAVGADGTVYVGSADGVYAFNPTDGTVKWTFVPSSNCDSPTIGPDGTLFVNCTGYGLVALSPSDGSILWTHPVPSTNGGTYAAVDPDGTVYWNAWGATGTTLCALNPADGSVKWAFANGGWNSSIGADGTIYFGSSDKNLYALNPLDGSIKWSSTTDGGVGTPPAIATDGTVYVLGLSNLTLYAFGP